MKPQLDPIQLSEIRERTLREVAKLPKSIGRYEIRGELGCGGMGIVYDAHDPSLDRAVAVKVIHRDKLGASADRSDVISRFEKEMRATSDIFHPNIIAILDAGRDGDQAYYVMERIEGESLEDRLRRCGSLPRRAGLEIAAAIARGLDAAHAKGLVHRDLKPSNIMLPEGGQPRIADFGLCRFRDEMASITDAGTILGSANYISPEQLRSKEVTGASDLFSLGAILVRIFSGCEPFRAESIAAHFQRILADEPDGLDDLDPDVRALALELLAKRPEDRPDSVASVALRLEAMSNAVSSNVYSMASHREGQAGPQSGEGQSSGSRGPTDSVGADSSPPAGRIASRLPMGAAIAAVLAVVVGFAMARNELVGLDEVATTQWKQVENQLARQGELIPQLVAITKKYVEYETQTLQTILDARSRYAQVAEGNRVEAAAGMERALDGLLVMAERYPNLKADAHYRALAYEVAGTRNRIAVERMRYNEAVGALNARMKQVPWSLVSGSLAERSFFDPTEAQMAEPVLDL